MYSNSTAVALQQQHVQHPTNRPTHPTTHRVRQPNSTYSMLYHYVSTFMQSSLLHRRYWISMFTISRHVGDRVRVFSTLLLITERE